MSIESRNAHIVDVSKVAYQESLLHSPLHLIALVGEGEQLDFVNETLCQRLGYESSRLLGKPFAKLLSENLQTKQNRDHLLTHACQEPYETLYQSATGELIPISLTLIPVLENGKLLHTVFLASDITEKKFAQEQLLRYQERLEELVLERTRELIDARDAAEGANRAKSDFFARMSHELRTPMHAVLSYANFGLKHSKDQPKLEGYFTKIKKSCDKLLLMVNDLLDFEKLSLKKVRYRLESTSMRRLALEVIDEQKASAASRDILLELQASKRQAKLSCDPNKIVQVLRNLISNAIKFSEENSIIEIAISKLKDPDRCQVIVKNKGITIPPAELEFIFDNFTQSSNTADLGQGAGLGLAICRGIVEDHGGMIWAENVRDTTWLIVELPY